MKLYECVHRQLRIIIALVLREIHTLYGHAKLGYVWAIIRSGFSIAIFWTFRTIMHSPVPHGMTVLSYLCMGFVIWNIFSETLTKCMNSISGNKPLLTFPQVFPLDIMIARSLVVFATQIVCISVILIFGIMLNYEVTIANIGMLISALIFAVFFGFGCGIILSTLSFYMPALQNIVPMILRIMFFASGVFFSVSMFSHRVGEWLLLNPVMQFIEMARTAMSDGYVSPYFDIEYLLMINLSVLTSGLLLERFNRRRLQA
ncbi:MAG: ABC transporter permease [Desulfovibrio sp.]|nr:ABC transporter permease [Desulfovibrio sp.]